MAWGTCAACRKALSASASRAVTRDVVADQSARGVVFPGVGAFSACMENLAKFDLIEPIAKLSVQQKPFLGICLGFQLLFSESEEFGKQKGLDLFPGKVVGFHANEDLKVPHMGWNRIEKKKDSPFLEGIRRRLRVLCSLFLCRAGGSRDRRDHHRLRQHVCFQHRHRQSFRLPVSSRKKPRAGLAHSRQLRPLRCAN